MYRVEVEMSASQLEREARKMLKMAKDLRSKQPTVAIALAHGVKDRSYNTVRWGRVASYDGRVAVALEDGSVWSCVGHGPDGDAECIYRHGYVEFIKHDF